MRDYPPDYLKTICTIDPLGSHRLLFTIEERSMKKIKIHLLLAISGIGSVSAMPVISSSLLNGSFEDGVLSPWSGGLVTENSDFAFEGSWFAETEATANRSSLFIFFDSAPNEITEFSLSFHSQASPSGFSVVSASLSGRKEDNSFLYADVITSSGSTLSTSGWTEYTYEFSFAEAWDTTKSMGLSIDFSGGTPGALGYLDSVTLTQVPEPSRYTLILSIMAVAAVLQRRVRSRRSYQHLSRSAQKVR